MTNHPLADPRIDWDLLRSYGFDGGRFRSCAARIADGTLSETSSILAHERIEPAPTSEVTDVAARGEAAAADPTALGREALSRGEIAVLVLNGGMATRFGGVVKGVVEVFGGESFLSLKAADVRRASETFGASIPLVLMNSFATQSATKAYVEARGAFGLPREDVLSFDQSVSLRLNPDGTLFIGNDGRPSYHAPGHGDFFECICTSSIIGQLRSRGVKILLFSNVDNLGATIDPTIIGYHLLSSADMTAEVTEKRRTASGEWDRGGAPALVGGHLQLVEGFRFPKDFKQEMLPDFSTNNMIFKTAAIDRRIGLERHVVRKTVDGRAALQLESITCEASALRDDLGHPLLALELLRVPREGPSGRFFPVKEPQDLEAMRGVIKRRLEEGWANRSGG